MKILHSSFFASNSGSGEDAPRDPSRFPRCRAAVPMGSLRSATRFALLLTLCGGGCARAQDSTAALPDTDERRALAVPVREVARSREDTLFSQITSIAVDSRGHVYVGDWMACRVAVLDSTGALVRVVGRKGLGPGEFRSIRGVQVLPGDSLLVFDPGAGRLSVFAPGQERPAYVVNVTAAAGGEPFYVQRTRANDAFLAMFRPVFRGDDTARSMERLQVLGLDGRPRGGPIRTYPARSFLRIGGTNGFAIMPNPFGNEGLYALGAGDRVHLLWSDSLAVETTGLRGERIGRFSVQYSPPRVARADVAMATDGMPPQLMQEFQAVLQASLPERWPAARQLLADPRGRLWIGLNTPAGQPREWAVFTPEGRYLASVFLPPGAELHAVHGDRVLAVQEDASGVPFVVAYQTGAQLGHAAR